MRNTALVLSLLLLAGCGKSIAQLESIENGLQRELVDKKTVAASLSERRREVEALRARIVEGLAATGITRDELHVSAPPEPESVAVPLPPLPEPSIWEGARGARLRAEIARLNAELAMLDKVVAEVRVVERDKREAEATLRAIDDLARAHGVNQANTPF